MALDITPHPVVNGKCARRSTLISAAAGLSSYIYSPAAADPRARRSLGEQNGGYLKSSVDNAWWAGISAA
jgi:hypothetical protein